MLREKERLFASVFLYDSMHWGQWFLFFAFSRWSWMGLWNQGESFCCIGIEQMIDGRFTFTFFWIERSSSGNVKKFFFVVHAHQHAHQISHDPLASPRHQMLDGSSPCHDGSRYCKLLMTTWWFVVTMLIEKRNKLTKNNWMHVGTCWNCCSIRVDSIPSVVFYFFWTHNQAPQTTAVNKPLIFFRVFFSVPESRTVCWSWQKCRSSKEGLQLSSSLQSPWVVNPKWFQWFLGPKPWGRS